MANAEENRALIAFTSLAPVSVGGLVGLLLVRAHGSAPGLDSAAAILLCLGVLALGTSLLHLGRPLRAPRALLRCSTSWLSREVAAFSLFIVSLGCYVFMPFLSLDGQLRFLVGALAALIGLTGMVATGQVYHLRSRPTWDSWISVSTIPLGALSAGILFGFFLSEEFSNGLAVGQGLRWTVVMFLAAALASTWLRSASSRQPASEVIMGRRLVFGPYRWALALRVLAILCSIVLLVFGGWALVIAWVPAVVGEIADRILFFCTVVPVSFSARSGAHQTRWHLGSHAARTQKG